MLLRRVGLPGSVPVKNPNARRVRAYKDVPNGSTFVVLKEIGFDTREGEFTKVGNSHATCPEGDVIFALSDVVRVTSFSDEGNTT